MDIERLAKSCLKDIQPYKAGRPVEEVQRDRKTKDPFIKLASNENPYPPCERIHRAVMDMLTNANRYPESGCFDLTVELAKDLGVEIDEVLVGNGSNEIIDLIVRAFVLPDENVIYAWPSFVIYKLVPKICGVEGIETRCTDYKIDLKEMLRAVNGKTKVIFISNPNNPTSTYISDDELSDFLESLPEQILIVIDEAYYEYVRASDYPQTLEKRKKRNTLVTLRTFSKIYSLAGVRIGYAIADRKVVEILHKVRQPFNVNRLAQAAAIAALKSKGEIQPIIEETVRERDAMRQAVLEIGCQCPPSETNFLFVITPMPTGELCERFLDRGIIVRDMTPFGAENAFRVTVGTPDENKKFISALGAIIR